jgi:hypothetical protein
MSAGVVEQKRDAPVKKSFRVRCFVYQQRSTGLFVGECIDLNLMVKARKPNKAMRELRDAVLGYVQVAVDSGQDSVLIPRRSPLSHRIHYRFEAAMAASPLSLLRGEAQLFECMPSAHSRCYA